MHLARKLFGEVLPFRGDPRRGHIAVKGGLAHDDDFFEADRVTLYPTDDGRLQAGVGYSGQIPTALHFPDEGSAVWFHLEDRLELRLTLPDGFFYKFGVKILSAPDFFLNDAGRPEPHPPKHQNATRLFDYLVEITDARWWSSDEHSAGHQWRFSVNDLPELPPLKESTICRLNTMPGVYPGAYFTCTLNGHQYPYHPVEYWFSYELESSIDRSNYLGDYRRSAVRNQYRVSFGRTDKLELDLNEGHRMVDLWEYLLGFCSGTSRTFEIIIGYGDTGGWCYAELPRALAKQSPRKSSWFPQEWPLDFPAFASQFLIHFQQVYDQHTEDNGVPVHFFDPSLRARHGFGEPIPILEGYLRAAALELPYDSLNAAFAVLEAQVKQHIQRPNARGIPTGEMSRFLRAKSIPPGSRSHSFGSYTNTAWQSPKEITGLKDPPEGATSWSVLPEYAPNKTQDPGDEEYGVTDIKNWRDKRASHFDARAGGGTFYDAQNYSNLILEYLELVILQQVGFTGTYRSRTGMFHEAVKPVPWEVGNGDSDHASQVPG